jgi:hypothetical protein
MSMTLALARPGVPGEQARAEEAEEEALAEELGWAT